MNGRYPSSLTTTTVLSILVAGLALLYQRGRSLDPGDHTAFIGRIKQLEERDSALNEQVLRLRAGFLDHYDPVVATIADIRNELATLESQPSPVIVADQIDVRRNLSELRFLFERKFELIEDFKSSNALLTNSERYFPGAVERVFASTDDDPELRLAARQLIVAAIRWLLHTDRGVEEVLAMAAVRSSESSGAHSRGDVALLIEQVRRLVSALTTAEHQLARLLEVPTQTRLRELEAAVHASYGKRVAHAETHRAYLYGLSAATLLYAVFTGINLFRATRELHLTNIHLEERVTRRTTQLTRKNDELEREVFERKRVEEELRRANQELDEFSYVASHDLQEPLRKLISFSGLLRQDLGDGLNERAEEDLHFITDAATRMKTLVQDLLELSRAGKRDISESPVSLDECVDDALEALATKLAETRAEVDRDALPVVCADRTLITQLFQNLIGNAIKFTREGEAPAVHIGTRQEADQEAIFVSDRGIGIAPEYAELVFSPFKRLHGRTAYEGTGIGLAICAKAVERHGGRIWVESTPGEGTTFLFTLPTSERSDEDAFREELEAVGHPAG